MSRIIVDTNRLGSYSTFLNSKKEEFATIKGNMMNIINALSKCWSGVDSIKFRVTALTYLDGLKETENSLSDSSGGIRVQENRYLGRTASAMSKLG